MIDVIVPVYKGLESTRRCLDSVLAWPQRAAFDIVVVDDASPEPAIGALLDELAGTQRITLLRNEVNRGFVHSVNRGMALHADRDVVLLNSDTEVANDWLDRLCRGAGGQADVGTVTPFSNNATICSYPFEGWEGGVPGTLGLAALDRLFATVNAGRTVELPTAVGFCMYIRRACLAQVGLFDEERFGRGYGEENEFCLRAARAGWRSILAGDVFVFHEGAVSFSAERAALTEHAGRTLVALHPDYLRKVRAFVASDPAAELRAAVDRARAVQGADELARVQDERRAERLRLVARLAAAQRYAEGRDDVIAKLEAVLGERDEENAALRGEIGRLRAGLAHAESLAFARARELEELQRSWLWKGRKLVLRIRDRRGPRRPA